MHERRVGVRYPVKPFQFRLERQLLYTPFLTMRARRRQAYFVP
jgi:hypothetical protein